MNSLAFTRTLSSFAFASLFFLLGVNDTAAQTIARTDGHQAELQSTMCAPDLIIGIAKSNTTVAERPVSTDEIEKLVAAVRIATQFECGKEPRSIYATVRGDKDIIQKFRLKASDGWVDQTRLTQGDFSSSMHEHCGAPRETLCVDIEVHKDNLPINQETTGSVIEHYRRYALENGEPRVVDFAFRRGDFLLNRVSLQWYRTGHLNYRLNYARNADFMIAGQTVQQEIDDSVGASVDDMISEIVALMPESDGSTSTTEASDEVVSVKLPTEFHILPPDVGSCLTTFDATTACPQPTTYDGLAIADSVGPVRLSEMSKALSGRSYNFFEIKAQLQPPTTDLQAFHDDYHRRLNKQFAIPAGLLQFQGSEVTVSRNSGTETKAIIRVPAQENIRAYPGYECFEAPSIGPGCYMLVHAERVDDRKHSFLYLAKVIEKKRRDSGQDTWFSAIVAIARPVEDSQILETLAQMRSAADEITLANAEAVARGEPKPYPSFEFANDNMRVFYANLYNDRGWPAENYRDRQTNQIIFHSFQSQFREICEAHIPTGSPVYRWLDTRIVDTEETENFDGSKTITDHYEWYVRDNVPVRSEYFEKFRRISDGFLDELRQEWVDSYRGPLKAMAFVDTSTPENNYWLYWDRVVSNFERYNRDHAAFLRQEGCASPTVQKYERAIDRLTLWE